jgi:phosphatidylglycerol---prolipoprotein diacylglyceryl transferase
MYPNLYYLFKDLFGIELPFLKMVQSFGFFVALAFLAAAYCFTKELDRKEREGKLPTGNKQFMKGEKATTAELWTAGIVGFLVGFKILYIALNFDAFLNDTQGFLLSTNGNFIGGLLGGGLGAYLKYREKDKEKLDQPQLVTQEVHPYELVGNMTMIAAGSGLLGAKLFDMLENLDRVREDFWGMLFSFSGLTMYGGLIFGAIAVLWYAHKHKLTLTHVTDACAPGLMLAYGVGRIGCQVAGDGDWGIANTNLKPGWMSFLPDWMWAYSFPHNVINAGDPIPNCADRYCHQLIPPVYPTPFYESVMCILLFFVLWSMRKKITTPGVLFCVYLIFNGIERFFIEKIRVNNTYAIDGRHITQAEIISTALFIIGIIGIWYFRKKSSPVPNQLL